MATTVEYQTRLFRGKECPVKVTRQEGLQEVMINGTPTLVEAVTITEGPPKLGTARSYTIARTPKTPEEVLKANVREVVTRSLINLGIW